MENVGLLYWTESHRLLCITEDGMHYTVLNGAWNGIRRGNSFEVLRYGTFAGQPGNTILTITDWEAITREEFDSRHPDFGY